MGIVVKMDAKTVLSILIITKKTTLNKMKNIIKSFFICLLLFLLSCEKEDENDIRNEFEGNWLANEKSSLLDQRVYEVMITKDSLNASGIYIYNFYKIGIEQKVFSTISSTKNNFLTIPNQTIKSYTIEGVGEIKDEEIILNYFINDGNEIDTLKATYTRDNT